MKQRLGQIVMLLSKLIPGRRAAHNFVSNNHRQKATMSTTSLSSSMSGPPICSLVEPGKCQFGEEWTSAPLIQRFPVSHTSSVFRFGLPDKSKSLGLSTCACILANQEMDGEDIVRPYTPISTNDMVGTFDMLVKNYGEKAHMSNYMHNMKPGDTLNFKHIQPNVKTQAPFPYTHVCMIVGGTGVTPMIQALHAILGDSECKTKVTMLYGSQSSNDILGSELLHKWVEDYSDRFQLVDILSHEPKDSDWDGARGFIDKELIAKHFPAPSDESFQIFICGPPPMYNALSGPRDEKDLKGVLGEMGYSPDQVYKF